MLDFIGNNFPTLVVGSVVFALIFAAAFKMIRDKKNGKSSCGCNCTNCPSSSACHNK